MVPRSTGVQPRLRPTRIDRAAASRRGSAGRTRDGTGWDMTRQGSEGRIRLPNAKESVPSCRFPSLPVAFGAHSGAFWRFGAPRLADFGTEMSRFGTQMSHFGARMSQSGTQGKRPKVKGRRSKGGGGRLEVRRRTRTSLASVSDLVPDFTRSCRLGDCLALWKTPGGLAASSPLAGSG